MLRSPRLLLPVRATNRDYRNERQTAEQQIRARAYKLWQLDGGLERHADEYWRMARALVEKEMAVPDASNTCDSGVLASG